MPVPAGPSQALGPWLVLKKSKIFSNGDSEELSNKVQYDLPYDYLIPNLFPGSYTKKIFNCLQAPPPHPPPPPSAHDFDQSDCFTNLLLSSLILPASLGSLLSYISPDMSFLLPQSFSALLPQAPLSLLQQGPSPRVTLSQLEVEFSFFEFCNAWLLYPKLYTELSNL